jgi:hypothetical protein
MAKSQDKPTRKIPWRWIIRLAVIGGCVIWVLWQRGVFG